MVNLFSSVDLTRKISTIKTRLINDGFYNDRIVIRYKTVSGASGLFDVKATVKYTDYVLSGIAEFGPLYQTNENMVETVIGDARFTVRESYASSILGGNELWLGCAFETNGKPSYASDGKTLKQGTKYGIKSNKSDLFHLDRIFILMLAGVKDAS